MSIGEGKGWDDLCLLFAKERFTFSLTVSKVDDFRWKPGIMPKAKRSGIDRKVIVFDPFYFFVVTSKESRIFFRS